jgi:diguanylate cyclase (GGDEF)-like protein
MHGCRFGAAAEASAGRTNDVDATSDFSPTSGPAALEAETLASLLDSTHSPGQLERCVAALVSERLGAPVAWSDAAEAPENVEPLLMLPGETVRVLAPAEPQPPEAMDKDLDALLGSLHLLLPSLMRQAERIGSLRRLAITDHLTGAYNRRYFYHLTNEVLLRGRDENFRATLLLYDVDELKHYNDRYGHALGDRILQDTARLIRQVSREQDIVARIGGDEFAVLFWDSDLRTPDSKPLGDAIELAERFRQAVETYEFPSLGPGASGRLTISGGLANFPEHGATCVELLRQADKSLRKAKQSGKNAILLVGADEPAD